MILADISMMLSPVSDRTEKWAKMDPALIYAVKSKISLVGREPKYIAMLMLKSWDCVSDREFSVSGGVNTEQAKFSSSQGFYTVF